MRGLPSLLLLAGLAVGFGSNQTWAGDIALGEKTYKKSCINCHKKNGKGVASFPSIAGRDPDYISDRLTKYRAREKVGNNSALMYSWAGKLSDDDIANLAVYVSETFK